MVEVIYRKKQFLSVLRVGGEGGSPTIILLLVTLFEPYESRSCTMVLKFRERRLSGERRKGREEGEEKRGRRRG